MPSLTTSDVSAIVCTLNSESGIGPCLRSLRESGVGQIILVDGGSTDRTLEIAAPFVDLVLDDPGVGLGNARNIGIAESDRTLVLNMGSDNVFPPGQLEAMIEFLQSTNHKGVSAMTRIQGTNYVSRGLNFWRTGRFQPGPRNVIGTPTLFYGELLRSYPYDATRKFSDDSELCERWAKDFGATFAISGATCLELGKASWPEVKIRAQMYGVSDHETFSRGKLEGWGYKRRLRSLLYPLTADLFTPLRSGSLSDRVMAFPFLIVFVWYRYVGWISARKPT